ncbi:unnamed protein product [Timema podura]|uniref:Uncharacterized protein n=1 Tax=Timema podura TaxID=61482 RepID=A0ABN7NIT7_TIMPD|nr:unnamed protein product [Timema podura]
MYEVGKILRPGLFQNAISMDIYNVSSYSPSSLVTPESVSPDTTCFPGNLSFPVAVVLCQQGDSSYFHRLMAAVHSLDNTTTTIELFTIFCEGREMTVEDCRCLVTLVQTWLFLDCTGGRQFGIESPVQVDCDLQLGICDWNISDNNTMWDKKMADSQEYKSNSCNIKQRRRTTSQTHNLADSEYLNFLTIRENTPRIAKDREELIVTYDPSVESFESSAVDSSPEDRPNMDSSRQQSPMNPTQGTRCIQSPENDYVVRRESSRSTIVPDIHESSFDQNNMTRSRNFLHSLRRRLASCLGLDPPLDLPHSPRKASNNETGLDDSSLEELLNKFNSLVLSFHWSDMTPIDNSQSDDELSISDIPPSVVSEMFVRRWSKQRLCRMMSEDDCRSTLWGSVASDRDTVFSCASPLSREGSFFSVDCLSLLDLAESLPLSE